jgi:putative ABC transport system permease protein
LLAATISQAILYVLYSRVMHIPFQMTVNTWLFLPIVGAVLVGIAGFWGVREVVNQSPMRVLRRL